MGLRAIPVTRLLAAHAATFQALFVFESMNGPVEIEPLLVFSPAMFLPVVISQASALATFLLGSDELLGLKRSIADGGIFGVEADIMEVDGSPQGILRASLMTYASELVFNLGQVQKNQQGQSMIDLTPITHYYRSEGAAAVRGERADVLNNEPRTLSF